MLVACLALALSGTGVGYAAATIDTSDIVDDAITSAKINDGAVKLEDIGPPTVRELQISAYASVVVSPRMSIEKSRSRGISKVSRPATGVYCLTLSDATIDAATTAPIVTVDWDNSSGANLSAFVSKTAFGCPSGSDIGVRTFVFKAKGPNKPSNAVAFTLLVP
jgi:hypothetical protein